MSKICPRLAIGIQNTIRTWTLRTTPFEVSKLEIVNNNKNSSTSLFSLKGEREGRKAETNFAVLCVL